MAALKITESRSVSDKNHKWDREKCFTCFAEIFFSVQALTIVQALGARALGTKFIRGAENFPLCPRNFFLKISYQYFYSRKKKNLVWHSHNFLLPHIIVEEYFIYSITFKFNLYFICFVVHELPSFIIIVYIFWT